MVSFDVLKFVYNGRSHFFSLIPGWTPARPGASKFNLFHKDLLQLVNDLSAARQADGVYFFSNLFHILHLL